MQRCTSLRPRFGQREPARVELEDGLRDARRRLRVAGHPAQPAGDHQVDHEEQLALEANDDALADPLDRAHAASLGACDRRHRGAQHERADDAHADERLSDDARSERFLVDGDVGQLGHRPTTFTQRSGGLRDLACRAYEGCVECEESRSYDRSARITDCPSPQSSPSCRTSCRIFPPARKSALPSRAGSTPAPRCTGCGRKGRFRTRTRRTSASRTSRTTTRSRAARFSTAPRRRGSSIVAPRWSPKGLPRCRPGRFTSRQRGSRISTRRRSAAR